MRPGERDLLLVVDVQNDFCPGGALAVPYGDGVVPAINRIAPAFRHIAMTQDWHPPGHRSFASSHPGRRPFEEIPLAYGAQMLWPDHCLQQTEGAAFHAGLELGRTELIIRKGCNPAIDSYSAFRENDRATRTGLAGYLGERGIERLFLAGLALDFCVRYSAEDARAEGFEALILEDACRAIDLQGSLAAAHASFRRTGVGLASTQAISGG